MSGIIANYHSNILRLTCGYPDFKSGLSHDVKCKSFVGLFKPAVKEGCEILMLGEVLSFNMYS